MSDYVVETNVAISANGIWTHASEACKLECIKQLRKIISTERVVVDDIGLLLEEYRRHLNHSGQPGTGDSFYKHIFNYQYDEKKVIRVNITPDGENNGFSELPANHFDPSDRKFLACAVVSNGTVVNATDSDWEEHSDLMNVLGVSVIQICPDHAQRN